MWTVFNQSVEQSCLHICAPRFVPHAYPPFNRRLVARGIRICFRNWELKPELKCKWCILYACWFIGGVNVDYVHLRC